MQKTDRDRYYAVLEAGDQGFHQRFPEPQVEKLLFDLGLGDFGPMEALLLDGVLPQLDTLIVAAVSAREPLQTLRAGPVFGVQEATLRQWATRGKLLTVKRGGRLMSHPELQVNPRLDMQPIIPTSAICTQGRTLQVLA